jgi:hypothetical protein
VALRFGVSPVSRSPAALGFTSRRSNYFDDLQATLEPVRKSLLRAPQPDAPREVHGDNGARVMKRQRTRIQPYIDIGLAKQLEMYCGAAGITESAAVQAALRQYLDRTSDATLILQGLARLGRAEERTKRDVEILSEAFGTWVEIWFAHTPHIDEELKSLARRSAARRYAQFVEHVSRRFSGGHRFIDTLPQEPIADEAELTRLAAGSDTTRPAGDEGSR